MMEHIYTSEGQGKPTIRTNFDKDIGRYKHRIREQQNLVTADMLPDEPLTQEDHQLIIETGILNSSRGAQAHEITMNILSIKPNTMYLARLFQGQGDWVTHYTHVLKKVDKVMKD